jgi:asparagine synthase (glutamine-hydrolysing)
VCGLAALLPSASPDLSQPVTGDALDDLEDVLGDALARLAHRGPDGTGVHRTLDRGLLGHRRLAIIDPAGGHQPLTTPEGDALVANGMIYNDAALRRELGAGAYRTGSDSESILHAVRRWGSGAPARLDGMFAFVYAGPDRVVAARDPLGIKPLYRVRAGEVEGFASEIKAFDGIADEVVEFPAGHVYDSRVGLRRYHHLPDPDVADGQAPEEAAASLREVLEAAVVKRLRSDVPLGALLSGGLDSSLVCALARRHTDQLHTFAVGLPGSGDLRAARLVADHLGTIHHELVVQPEDLVRVLPEVVWHLESADVDLVRSAVVTWMAMRLAAEHVTVVLTGEGADELFAGYRYHAGYQDPAALQRELRRSLGAMHNINLQRVDRMSMAHGVEARVPYLDRSVVAAALGIHPRLKQRDPATGAPVEKWVLRSVADGLLPGEVVWRAKAQFDEGTGASDLLPRVAQTEGVDEAEWYRELLAKRFDAPEQVLAAAGTWASDRTPTGA